MVAVPPNATSLLLVVTGVGGQLGSYTALTALKAGYRVRATTTRSPDCRKLVVKTFENNGISRTHMQDCLEFIVVDDFGSEEQWLPALRGADAVIHAGLLLLQADILVGTAISQTLAILRAAQRTPTMKRIIMSSTLSTIVTPGLSSDKIFTANDWNEAALNIDPLDVGPDDTNIQQEFSFAAYAAVKTKAALAVWEFMSANDPHFDLSAVLFGAIYGPTLSPEVFALSQSQWIKYALQNDITPSRTVPTTWFTDVRDAAQLQIMVLSRPDLGNRRLIAGAAAYGWNDIFTILRQNFKDLTIPENFEGGISSTQWFDNTIATELLGKWISLEQSIVDFGVCMGY